MKVNTTQNSFGSLFRTYFNWSKAKGAKAPKEMASFCNENGIYYSFDARKNIGGKTCAEIADMMGTFIIPNEKDFVFENYCATNGIKYSKVTYPDKPLEDRAVKSKMYNDDNYEICLIDVDRFLEIHNKHKANNRKEEIYLEHQDQFNSVVLVAPKVEAPCLEVLTFFDDDVLEMLKAGKCDEIETHGIEFDFESYSDYGKYLVFAAKDLGLKKFPVIVSQETKEICEAMGLIAK